MDDFPVEVARCRPNGDPPGPPVGHEQACVHQLRVSCTNELPGALATSTHRGDAYAVAIEQLCVAFRNVRNSEAVAAPGRPRNPNDRRLRTLLRDDHSHEPEHFGKGPRRRLDRTVARSIVAARRTRHGNQDQVRRRNSHPSSPHQRRPMHRVPQPDPKSDSDGPRPCPARRSQPRLPSPVPTA